MNYKVKKIIATSVLVFSTIGVITCCIFLFLNQNNVGKSKFSNQSFEVTYPNDWYLVDERGALENEQVYIEKILPSSRYLDFSITYRDKKNNTLDEWVNLAIDSLKSQGVKELSQEKVKINNYNGIVIEFISSNQQTSSLFLEKDGRLYTISYFASEDDFETYVQEASDIRNSFKFK